MGAGVTRIYSAELTGIDAGLIEVEADVNIGLHSFNIVGLADRSLNEAKERVNSAVKNSGMKPPNRENRKITINLAPADIQKNGSHYDLAIAISYLSATNQIKKFNASDKIFLGELALDGRLRPVHGVLSIAQCAHMHHLPILFVPMENADEAAAVEGVKVVAISNLKEAIRILEGGQSTQKNPVPQAVDRHESFHDFSEIRGQENAKRALTIAAAGKHNVLMVGPPGVGKSFLAQAMQGILPPLDHKESIEVTKIWSAAGIHTGGLIHESPFRAPHHTSSIGALIGGGSDPRPGEISMAHRGVLFMDEFPEFPRNAIEALRQPLESGCITLARAQRTLTIPAQFLLVAAMNPCPCGYLGDERKECRCGAYDVIKYRKKISGPMMDRIDLRVYVERVASKDLAAPHRFVPANGALREQVQQVRRRQSLREDETKHTGPSTISMTPCLTGDAQRFLENLEDVAISPRGYYRLIRVARTIADLEGEEAISNAHLAEAFSYRLRE